MALIYCDSFDHYESADSIAKWDIGTAPIASVGRRATKGLNWTQNARIARNIGSQTELIAGCAIFPESSGYTAFNNGFLGLANRALSNHMVFAFGYQSIMQVGVAFTNDGALHVVRGAAFDLGANNQQTVRVASSAAGAFPLTGWQFLEMKVTPTSAIVRVNGQAVINYSGTTIQEGMPSEYTQFGLGGYTFGALAGTGWSGKVDDLYLFNTSGTTNNDFIGDVRCDYLKPDGAGAVSDSVIGGSSPAATRWESVADQTPDDDVTFVTLAAVDDEDSYTHEDLEFEVGTVYAVQGVAYARKSDSGIVGMRHTQRVNSLFDEGPIRYPAGGEYAYFLTPFDESADGAWTVTKVNDSEFGLKVVE